LKSRKTAKIFFRETSIVWLVICLLILSLY
jgi:hypothetical protein